jgi:isopentenyldiphosphate isomerase
LIYTELMRVAILWLINEHGEILMARRAVHMSSDAGMWGPSVSGKVDPGETFVESVRREANEELGLTAADISPIFLHKETYRDHSDGKKREFGLFYATVPSSITKRLKLEANEVSDVKWFKKDELQRLASVQSKTLIISSAKELWENIFSHLSPVLTT